MSGWQDGAEWYYSTDGASTGPVSRAELRHLVATGVLEPRHFVRHQGWDKWWSVRESAKILEVDIADAAPAPEPPAAGPPAHDRSAAESSITTSDGASAAGPVEAASFQTRVMAWVIDGAVLLLALVVLNRLFDGGPAWGTLGVVAIYVGYTFGSRYQGYDTLGHLAFGLEVVDAETGERAGWLPLAARSAVLVLLALPLLLGLIGSVVAASAHPRAMAWHDLATGTLVARTGRRGPG